MAAHPFAQIPPGFFAANEILNELPEEVTKQMISDGQKLQSRESESMPLECYEKLLPDSNRKNLSSAINAVLYIIRELSNSSTQEPKALNKILERETDLAKTVRAQFALSFKGEDGEDAKKKVTKSLALGKLVDIKWKLGMGMASSSCAALKAPFVSLVLSIADKVRVLGMKTASDNKR
eukprot:jgi/Bigna1/83360/fgenesh1_pg.107_\